MDNFDSQNNTLQTTSTTQPVEIITSTPVMAQPLSIVVETEPSGAYGRFAANLWDGICLGLVGVLMLIIFELLFNGTLSIDEKVVDQLIRNNVLVQVSSIFVFFGYYLWFNVNKGSTPGKSAYKLTIVKYKTQEKMGYIRAVVREFAKSLHYFPLIGTVYFLINAIIILFSKQKRPIYDLIAGTQVIKK